MHATDITPQFTLAPGARLAPQGLASRQILSCALPFLGAGDRILLRAVALLARGRIMAIHGLHHVRPAQDPFILAMNHGTRRESVLVPAMLFLLRGGRIIHFLADWNFCLIPGVGLMYSRGQVVTVTRKTARPRLLNIFKPLYDQAMPALERARAHLLAGRPIGIFPEGTVNRDPHRLLRGRGGAARLSLETGVPVVPMGIRFPSVEPGHPIPGHAALELHIGAPLVPPPSGEPASLHEARAWHATIMTEIAHLSGKAWAAPTQEACHGRS